MIMTNGKLGIQLEENGGFNETELIIIRDAVARYVYANDGSLSDAVSSAAKEILRILGD